MADLYGNDYFDPYQYVNDYDPTKLPYSEDPMSAPGQPASAPTPPPSAPQPSAPSGQQKPGDRERRGDYEYDALEDQWEFVPMGPAATPQSPQSQSQVNTPNNQPLPPVQTGTPDNIDIEQLLRQFVPQPQEATGTQTAIDEAILRLIGGQDEERKAFEEQIRQQIMALIQQTQLPIDVDAINNTPEGRSMSRQHERTLQRFRGQQAEARGTKGVGGVQGGEIGGALQSDIATGERDLAERIGVFESQLVARQMDQRRQQLMQALQLGAGILSNDQSNAIRKELSALDAGIRQQLGRADVGLRSFLGGGQLSVGLLEALMRNQLGYDQLGYQIGRDEALFNQGSMGYF